jgi:hypothetical protein
LRGRENLGGLRFLDVPRRLRARQIDDSCRHIAQEPDVDLAVEIDVLDELRDEKVLGRIRQTHERAIPYAPRVAELVLPPARIQRIRLELRRGRALCERAQRRRGGIAAAAHHVELVVEYEQVPRWRGLRERLRHEQR